MLNKICLLGLLLLSTIDNDGADSWQIRLDVESYNYSEPIPVLGILKDNWNHRFNGGNRIFTHNHILFGAQYGKWSFDFQQRFDNFAVFTEETAELVYYDENDLAIPINRQFTTELNVNRLRAIGIGASYQWQWSKTFDTRIRLNIWQPNYITKGHINGIIQTNNDASFDAELLIDYSYTEDLLFARKKKQFSGNGISLDWQFNWQYSPQLQVVFKAADFYNRFQWRDATYTQARVTSNTTNFDENGFINFSPILSGIEGFRDHRQKIPARYQLNLTYQLSTIALLARARQISAQAFYQFGAKHTLATNKNLSWLFDPEHVALTVSLESGDFQFSITTDKLNISDAHLLSIKLSWLF